MQEALLSSLPKLVNLMSSTVEGLVLVFLFVEKLGAWEIEIVSCLRKTRFCVYHLHILHGMLCPVVLFIFYN